MIQFHMRITLHLLAERISWLALRRRYRTSTITNDSHCGALGELGTLAVYLYISLWGLKADAFKRKTQIALQVAYSRQNKASVFWVHADNHARFSQDYRKIAKFAELTENPNETEQEFLFRVKVWLESPLSGPWIIIVDNADNLAEFFPSQVPDADGKKPIGLALYLPQGTKGCILITTRDRVVASRLANQDILEVKAMSPDEAEALLLRYAPDSIATTAAKAALPRLLEEVKFLPLAIVAAAAFMRENDVSTLEYLELYTQSKQAQSELMGSEFYDFRRGAEVPEAVLTTYFMPFQRLQRQSPLATDFLRLIAFLDRNGIPKELLVESRLEGTESPVKLTKAVGQLLSLGLMTKNADGSMYHVHQLVHLSIEAFFPDEDGSWRVRAQEILLRLFEINTGSSDEFTLDNWNWDRWAIYSPHVLAATAPRDSSKPLSHTERELLLRHGIYLQLLGHADSAAEHLRRCLLPPTSGDSKDELLDSTTVESYVYLGKSLESQLKSDECIELYESMLRRYEPVLGRDHTHVLAIYGTLIKNLTKKCGWESEGGVSLVRAEELCRKLLETRQSMPIGDVSALVGVQHGLAKIARLQQKHDEAEMWYNHAIINAHGAGCDELSLICISMRARMLQFRDRHHIADELLNLAMKKYEIVQASEQPPNVRCFTKLARALSSQCRYDEAEMVLRRAVTIYETAGVSADLITLKCVSRLAMVLDVRGKSEEAEELLHRVLQRWEKVLGPANPITLKTVFDLAAVVQEQGRYDEAEQLYQRAYEGHQALFGDDHPLTIHCVAWRAIVRAYQGKHEQAENECKQAAEGYKKVYGVDHPNTKLFVTIMAALVVKARESQEGAKEPIRGYLQKLAEGRLRGKLEETNGGDLLYTILDSGEVIYDDDVD
jgi:tetratricopeptide (TPR) repeat protein